MLLRGIRLLSGFAVCLCAAALTTPATAQTFTTIINVPPDVAPQTIGSDTQLNLFDGGRINGSLWAGLGDGSSTNVEVNFTGGSVSELRANSGSTINISGGSLNGFQAEAGSITHFTGGIVRSQEFLAENNSLVTISGGTFYRVIANSGSTIVLSGGDINVHLEARSGSHVSLHGADFRLNSTPLSGLESSGDSIPFTLAAESVLTGILADGTVFVLDNQDWCSECNDDVLIGSTLIAATPPSITQYIFNDPSELEQQGLRPGQTLNLGGGASIGSGFTTVGAEINLNGGKFGEFLDIADSVLNITNGSIEGGFDAFNASIVNMQGGSIGETTGFDPTGIHSGSVLNLSGGTILYRFTVHRDSIANLSGGTTSSFTAARGGTVNISGGEHIRYSARPDSTTNILGLSFILDGVNLTPGLTLNEIMPINDRDVVLEGILADGSPFSFNIRSSTSIFPDANWTITLVPEPGTLGLIGIGALCALRHRRMS